MVCVHVAISVNMHPVRLRLQVDAASSSSAAIRTAANVSLSEAKQSETLLEWNSKAGMAVSGLLAAQLAVDDTTLARYAQLVQATIPFLISTATRARGFRLRRPVWPVLTGRGGAAPRTASSGRGGSWWRRAATF